MEVLKTGAMFPDEVATLAQHWGAADFFFVHYKDTDKAGEDGDFPGKVAALSASTPRCPTSSPCGPT